MKWPTFSIRRNKPEWHWPLLIRRVHGHSMVPTLPPGTLVVASRIVWRLREGDVIIFEREGRENIKRIERINNSGVFVLGDHPETSTDSRHFGYLPLEQVMAQVVWPNTTRPKH